MRLEHDDPDHDRDFAPLIEELERYGGTLTVADGPSATSPSRAVHLQLPDDEYLAARCREVLQQWHNNQK